MAEETPTQSERSVLSPEEQIASDASSRPMAEADTFTHPNGEIGFITADEFSDFSDEGYSESETSSYLSSIASNVRRGVEENGRVYPTYGKNMYGMPMDEQELDRNDLQHSKFQLILDGRLHLAPISESPQKILDLGTGTGIWAMDMADKYPSAQVTGVDIAPVQPTWVPPNCLFELDDVEADWSFKMNSFDFIHAREFLTAIRDWDRLVQQSLDHLKPGGWMELSGTIPDISSDDNTIPENSAYLESGHIFFDLANRMGSPLDAPRSWKQMMDNHGFEDVTEVVIKIPMGPWAKDKRLKQIGAVELMMLLEGFEAYLLRGYTQILGGDPNVLQILLAQARKEISNPKIHTYVFYHIVYGRKPSRPH